MGRFRKVIWTLLLVLLTAPLAAQEERATQPWQEVITAQIEAFRAGDAPGAFQYAAASFHSMFPSAEAFFMVIIGSGYAPIMDSTSHSFGTFHEVDANSVAQQVMLTGKDLSRHEAIYLLTEEEQGWRVSGVRLAEAPGMGV